MMETTRNTDNQGAANTQAADSYEPTWARSTPTVDQRSDEPYDPLFKGDLFE